VVIFLIGSLFFYPFGIITLSLLAGGLIMTGNFRLLSNVIREAILDSSPKKSWLLIKIWVKFFALLGIVGAVLILCKLNILAFFLGTTNIFWAIMLSGIRSLKPNPELRRLNGRTSF
jgi:hypothetical protein